MATIINVKAYRDINKIFGENLQRIIKEKRLDQPRLAQKMGVSTQYINGICKGHKYVSKDILQRLCTVLDIEPWALYLTEDAPLITNPSVMKIEQTVRENPDIALRLEAVAEAFAEYKSHSSSTQKKTTKRKRAA